MEEVQITGGAGVRVAADEVDFADGNPTRMVQLLKIISGKDGEKYPWQIDQFLRGLVYPDGLRKRMKDEFSGAVVDLTKWNVTPFGGGGASVTGSVLTMTTGDALSGSGVELLSVDTFTAPCRLVAVLNSISQRIANQEFSIELVEAATVAGSAGTDAAKLLFNGTVVTTAQVTTLCTGDQDGPNNWTTPTTAAAQKLEIDLMPDEVWYYAVSTLNGTGVRNNYAHQDRKTPDPTKTYRIRIRLRNTAAAASLTTVALDSIVIEDNAYIPVELAHARGSQVGAESLSVTLGSSPGLSLAIGVGEKGSWFDETAVALGAAATFTGTSRDLAAAATGSQAIGTPGAYRVLALQDVVGTLYIEASHDGVTWHRVRGVALTQFDATCRFQARIEEPQIARFYRAVLVNGAGAAAVTRLFSKTSSIPGT